MWEGGRLARKWGPHFRIVAFVKGQLTEFRGFKNDEPKYVTNTNLKCWKIQRYEMLKTAGENYESKTTHKSVRNSWTHGIPCVDLDEAKIKSTSLTIFITNYARNTYGSSDLTLQNGNVRIITLPPRAGAKCRVGMLAFLNPRNPVGWPVTTQIPGNGVKGQHTGLRGFKNGNVHKTLQRFEMAIARSGDCHLPYANHNLFMPSKIHMAI